MARQLACPAPLPRLVPVGCVRAPRPWELAGEAARAARRPDELVEAWQQWLSCAELEHFGRLDLVGGEAS
eukprot:11203691-Lingulodinium_polyedra.AAC.1